MFFFCQKTTLEYLESVLTPEWKIGIWLGIFGCRNGWHITEKEAKHSAFSSADTKVWHSDFWTSISDLPPLSISRCAVHHHDLDLVCSSCIMLSISNPRFMGRVDLPGDRCVLIPWPVILNARLRILRGSPTSPGFVLLQCLVARIIPPWSMVDKWRTSLLRYTLVHDINDFIGNLSASLFRIVFRKVSQQASASSFLKPFQSAVLYNQTCLGWRFWQLGGFQHSLNQITVRWTDVVDYRNWRKRIRSVCYDEFEFKGFAGSNIGGHLEFDIC